MKKVMQRNLARQILIALILGGLTGTVIQLFSSPDGFSQKYLVAGLFNGAGAMFVAMIKMLVVPLVFVSIVHAVCALEDIAQVGRLGFKTFSLYLATRLLQSSLPWP